MTTCAFAMISWEIRGFGEVIKRAKIFERGGVGPVFGVYKGLVVVLWWGCEVIWGLS